jgi:hypothetical protein
MATPTKGNPLGIGCEGVPRYFQPGAYPTGFHSGNEVLGGITVGGCEYCGGTLQRIGSSAWSLRCIQCGVQQDNDSAGNAQRRDSDLTPPVLYQLGKVGNVPNSF